MVRTSYLVQGFDDLIDLLLGQGQAHRRADKDHVLVPILHGRTSFFLFVRKHSCALKNMITIYPRIMKNL